MDFYGKLNDLDINEKSKNDYVTAADKASEAYLINELKKTYPDISVLAEESGHHDPQNTRYWIIDPLDGTRNFIHGLPFFSISLALYDTDQIKLGIIFDPIHNHFYSAEKGNGAFKDGKAMQVSKKTLDKAFLATGFPFHRKQVLDAYLHSFHDVFGYVGNIRRCGSAALDLAYVADGKFDGFWEIGLNKWDFAAGVLMVEEAGGVVSDFNNTADYFESGNIIAANKTLHNELYTIIHTHFK
ncbi:MAG: inositol monophosphatase [Calditrichaeota bacterium]|nr:inositol monophosphatase [Calditrichota bacterium]